MTDIWIVNVVAHALQAALLTGAGVLIHVWLRRAHPALRLALWQTVLVLIVLLPVVQRWEPVPAAATAGGSLVVGAVGGVTGIRTSGGVSPSVVALAILASGALLRLCWLAAGLIRLRLLKRTSHVLGEDELPRPVARAMREVGVTAEFRSSDTAGPVSFGAIHPVVMLPGRFLSFDERSQYLVAAHELQHVRRRDWLQAIAEEAAAALLWYQPWIWWVRSQIRLAREQVVDRRVGAPRTVRDAYVQVLLKVAGHQVPALSSGVAVPRVSELRDRIDALYKEVSMSRVRIVLTTALCGLAIVSFAAAAATMFPLHASAAPIAVLTQASPDDEPVHIGGKVKPPRKIKDVKPVYPPEAKDAGIQGVVVLETVVGRDGLVKDVTVQRSVPELDQAAIDAVQQWEFEPTYIKGKAVSVIMTVTVNFTLQ